MMLLYVLSLVAREATPDLQTAFVRAGLRTRHVTFEQLEGGLPVLGSRVAVHFGRDGEVLAVRSKTFELAVANLAPAIDQERAAELARAASGEPGARCRKIRLALLPEEGGAGRLPTGRLVYECRVTAIGPPGPPASYYILIDAADGRIVRIEDRSSGFDGSGRVFDPNPVVTLRDPSLRDEDNAASAVPETAYRDVVLKDLLKADGAYTLSGPHVTTEGTPDRASDPAGRFIFARDDPRFEEVMVYYHIDAIQRRIQALGFDAVCNRPIQAFVNAQPPGIPYTEGQARYIPDGEGTGVLSFGSGGVDSAEDGEVIAHEYAHAILDHQVPDFGTSREALALNEGFGDFLAAAHFAAVSGGYGDPCIGEWKATTAGGGRCLRSIENSRRYPYDMTYGDRYEDSLIWSGTLWELAGSLGADTVLALTIEANFFLAPDASFPDAGEALRTAARQLFDGAYEKEVERVLRARGIIMPTIRLDGFTIVEPRAAIPDADPFGFESALEYESDTPIASALSLRIHVDIEHTFPPDLAVSVVSPAGTELPLTPPWRFPTIYGSLDQPPAGSLAAFAGQNARGTWRLRVVDGKAREKGTLRAWGIRVRNIIRGEANRDGTTNLADPVAILLHLFRSADLACETRGDANDDGAVNIADAVYLLGYLFAKGPPPPPPFAAPGDDPTLDDLRCAE